MPGLTPLTTAYDFGNNLKRTMSAPIEKHQTDSDNVSTLLRSL